MGHRYVSAAFLHAHLDIFDSSDEDSFDSYDMWQNAMEDDIMWFHNNCAVVKDNSTDFVDIHTEEFLPNRYDGVQHDRGKFGRQLGQALQKNTVVSSVTLDLYTFREYSHRTERAMTKAQRTNLAPLVRFVSTGPALRSVAVCDERGAERTNAMVSAQWGDAVLESMARNVNVQSLDLDSSIRVTPTALTALLQTTSTSLVSLELCLSILDENATPSQAFLQVAQALGQHRTLEVLRLHVTFATSTRAGQVLESLTAHSSGLRELDLLHECEVHDETHARSIAALTGSLAKLLAATKTIRHVTLGSYHFYNAATMQTLIHGLQSNHGASSSLTELSLVGQCVLVPEATRVFLRYWHEQSTVRELNVSDWSSFQSHEPSQLAPRSFLLLPYFLGTSLATPTSSLQVLTTSGTGFAAVMQVLGQHAQSIRLPCVQFTSYPLANQYTVLCQTLAQTVHLKELSFAASNHASWTAHQIVDAVRANSSLVRLSGYFDADRIPSRLQAYLTRNETIPIALANPPRIDATNTSKVDNAATNTSCRMDLLLWPSLFQVSKSMPASKANMLLTGLKIGAGDDTIGPTSSILGKRRAGDAKLQ